MLIGVVADDYTGASDVANTLAKGGLSTVQALGLPQGALAVSCDACVISLKTRSIAAADAVRQSVAATEWLLAQGCRQILFKICSTFDSTPSGNIGPVASALADRLGVSGGVAVCPAFPTVGRTVYRGHLFVNDRLLNESGLESHPLNPMTDPDIRRWLARQTKDRVGLVAWPTVADGADAIARALDACAANGERFAIVDAIRDADLLAIGRACRDAKLLVGGSGIALGLPENLFASGEAKQGALAFRPVKGPEAILAGSCSRATLGQIEHHRKSHPVLAIDVDAVMAGKTTAETIAAFMRANIGRAPLAYSSSSSAEVEATQKRYGAEVVSGRLDALFAETARALVASGVTRLVVAGGETSGAVVSALDLSSLAVGPEIDPGVPALSAIAGAPLALALKSGNFGGPDFFAKAAAILERGA